MVTSLEAANEYKIDHLKSPEIWKLVEQAKIYYVGGYHLTVCPDAAMALAKEAAEKNKIYILSLSAPFIPQFFKDPLAKTAPYWDYVIGNETEARAWAASQDLKTEDVKEIAEHLAKLEKVNGKRKRVVVITRGPAAPVVKVPGDAGGRVFGIRAVAEGDICDTTGAG